MLLVILDQSTDYSEGPVENVFLILYMICKSWCVFRCMQSFMDKD